MERAPVWVGDIQGMDCGELRGRIDIVCGGIPCQPYSVAGQQRGNDDERALWHEFARIVGECRPSVVFIENVPTFVTSGGFRPLGEELCRMGYEIEDPLFLAASDVGAPHRRERVFILAVAHAPRRRRSAGQMQRRSDAEVEGSPEVGKRIGLRGETVADPEGLNGRQRERYAAFPPGPADTDAWRAVLENHPHLEPAVEPGVRLLADELAVVLDESRADQLRCSGNGVVPLQAAVALRTLMQRAGLMEG